MDPLLDAPRKLIERRQEPADPLVDERVGHPVPVDSGLRQGLARLSRLAHVWHERRHGAPGADRVMATNGAHDA